MSRTSRPWKTRCSAPARRRARVEPAAPYRGLRAARTIAEAISPAITL